jgi:hypothetical protein
LLGFSTPRLNSNSTILRFVPAPSAGVFALISICFAFIGLEESMPISGNILIPKGLGPYSSQSFKRLPSSLWGVVTVLSMVGGALLVNKMTALTMTASLKK